MKLKASFNKQKRSVLATAIYLSIGVGGVNVPLQAATDCTQTNIPQTECKALIDLYNNTKGESWVNNTGWNETNDPCGWYEVKCDNGHVIELNLGINGLEGTIPDSLQDLTQLRYLIYFLTHY